MCHKHISHYINIMKKYMKNVLERMPKVPFWIQNRIFIGEGDLTTKTPIIIIGAAKEANILLGPA